MSESLWLVILGAAWLIVVLLMIRGYASGRRKEAMFKRKIVAHTRDDKSIEGILVADYPGHYVLHHARLLVTEEEAVALEGDVLVPKGNLAFFQRLPE